MVDIVDGKRAFCGAGLLAAVSILLVGFIGCGKAAGPSVSAESFASPNLLVNRARIEFVKSAVAANEPVLSTAYADLLRTADYLVQQSPNPIRGELKVPGFYTDERETQQRIVRQLRKDARISNALALACAMSGEKAYGEKSREFIFAWVDNLTRPVNGGHWWQQVKLARRGDTPLAIAYSFPAFMYAFDLLRGEGLVNESEVERFRGWLRPFVEYHLPEELYKNNHHNWQVVFLMCAGHVLQDADLFDRACRYYRHGLRGQIGADGRLPKELGREEKSGTYILMALEGMVQAVQIAEAHGVMLRDLKSKRGATLEDAVNFYCGYLDDPVAWARHTNSDKLNAPADRSDWGYILELPYRWWRTPRYLGYMQKRPYGYDVERCYTMDFATLLFAKKLGTDYEFKSSCDNTLAKKNSWPVPGF